jgi:hypothetical protein
VKDVTFFYTTVVFASTGEKATLSNGSLASSRVSFCSCFLRSTICSRLVANVSRFDFPVGNQHGALAECGDLYLPQVLDERTVRKNPDIRSGPTPVCEGSSSRVGRLFKLSRDTNSRGPWLYW